MLNKKQVENMIDIIKINGYYITQDNKDYLNNKEFREYWYQEQDDMVKHMDYMEASGWKYHYVGTKNIENNQFEIVTYESEIDD